jgi:rubrerythrin
LAERVGRERILREEGYLYFLGKDGYVWKTPTKLNKDGRKARVGSEKINREDDYMYFLDKSGFVSRARMLNTTSLRARPTSTPASGGVRTVIHTIERQVVKIRCRHCGNLVNEVEGKCPSCGAPL